MDITTATSALAACRIAFYIQHSGAEWGILTNGWLWRIFHAAWILVAAIRMMLRRLTRTPAKSCGNN